MRDVHRDKVPRIIEQGGEDVAVVPDPVEYRRLTGLPQRPQDWDAILALGGAWADLDLDAFEAYVERARRAASISPPVEIHDLESEAQRDSEP